MSVPVLETELRPESNRVSTTVVTASDDTDTCSGPECDDDCTGNGRFEDTDYTYTVSCTQEGMAADYGDVQFCSLDCARAFVETTSYTVDHDRTDAPYHDLIIHTGDPWHGVLKDPEGVMRFHCFGYNKATVFQKCDEYHSSHSPHRYLNHGWDIVARPIESSDVRDLITKGTKDLH